VNPRSTTCAACGVEWGASIDKKDTHMTNQGLLDIPAVHDPVDWLDTQLKRLYDESGKLLTFYGMTLGKRVSELLPKLALRVPEQWRWKYPTDKDFVDGFNQRLKSEHKFYGQVQVVYDTPNTVTLAQAVRFRHV
jgi:hypothetical protein